MGDDHVSAWPEWYAALPVTIASAGVLFFDGAGRVMLVHTSYKDDWDIPGGIIETDKGETPVRAARREIAEELGLDIEVGPLLCIDQVPATSNRRPMLAFIFDGGVLHAEELGGIRFIDSEITETRFCTADEVTELAPPSLARRLAAAIKVRDVGAQSPIFLSDGS
ncbi:NUDIX hydrolase [Acrocarpospora macrocephala]|uniref:NUDIX hydrolase n=1 Tax=Acrocarpospora macrocephala TaxID=150177 RepID=A0A5M3XCH8_9ACTN|nr:NUDIX hydrolase [Acrocarpospora macrocephala]GES15748.1 NUDIX hydrolase [Acrocarpospora macrocephala]